MRSTTIPPSWESRSSIRPPCSVTFHLYTRLEDGEPAPEFQIYSAQTAANRADIVNTFLYGALDKSTTVDLTPFLPSGGDISSMVDYISKIFLHHAMSSDLQAGRDQRGLRRDGGQGASAGRTICCTDLERVPDHSVGETRCYDETSFALERPRSERWLLRRFAEIPALAQAAPDYRALVCVFLYGGNDSNNTIIPMDDAQLQALPGHSAAPLALPSSALTQVQSAAGAPYGFFSPLGEVASMFSSKELAVVANVGSLVATDHTQRSIRRRRRPSLRISFRTPTSSSNGKAPWRRVTVPPVGAAGWPITSRRRG